ncbi:MAG: nickel-dependent hydrogenase large subunit [Desulfuromonadales bacterium]
MAEKIVVDPITRIEGHLRIEATIEGGKVTDAWSSSTMFRGIEIILRGRDPRDAHHFTQRICGVCTTVHSIASIRCVEDALGIPIPDNARLLRNLIMASQLMQDHVIHFYHLHALDWVDLVNALEADPQATAKLARSVSDWSKSGPEYFQNVKQRLAKFAQTGRLGVYANAYWGHSAYRLPPEANLMAVAHYLEALDWQREMIKIHAILGSKNPHPQTFLVGGMARPIDPDSQNALNAHSLARLRDLFEYSRLFVEKVYIPDLLAVASFYKDWAKIGGGVGNFLAYGDYPMTPDGGFEGFYFPRGVVLDRDISQVFPVDQEKISEYVARSWYTYDREDQGLHPFVGETNPLYTGPDPPYDFLTTDDKYSWVKAPRYMDRPMEVGPLARMVVGYAGGHPEIQQAVDALLKKLGVGPEALFSTLGRTAARGIETLLIADKPVLWLDELADNMARGILAVHNGEKWDPVTWPRDAWGVGFHEAPRGALGHWININDGFIANYQAVVPTTWNSGPRDAKGRMGPYEAALIDTPIADSRQPLEILRTIHSFDPCMACAVHVLDGEGGESVQVRVS